MKNIKISLDRGKTPIKVMNMFERSIGYLFPQSYKDFISNHNAAYPAYNYVDFFNTFMGNKDCRDVNFFGYGNTLSKSERIDLAQIDDGYCPDGIITFAQSANGDYICFDYRQDHKTDNPPIVVMYHDVYNEDNTKMYVDFVANNFDEFMDSLYGFDDNDQKIVPD